MTTCRSCGQPGVVPILDLGAMPLANAFVSPGDVTERTHEERFPLALQFCPHCALGQLSHIVPPAKLFADYAYLSSTSATMVTHARTLAERLIEERALGPTSRVVELASNDGYLLQWYAARGVAVLGVEPAAPAAAIARARGIPTLEAFFDLAVGQQIRAEGPVDVVHAHNVLAHVPALHGFVAGIAALIGTTGVAVIEVPDARAMLEKCLFDTIYHEHVYTFTLSALQTLARAHQLDVIDVEAVAIHGGSLRVFLGASPSDSGAARVEAHLAQERAAGVHDAATWHAFAKRVQLRVRAARDWLEAQARDGRRIAAYGAAAKGTVFLNAMHANTSLVSFVVDKAATKQGKLMPGVHIPIEPPASILAQMPDAVVILAWNIAPEIQAQEAEYQRRGGRFFVFDDVVREL